MTPQERTAWLEWRRHGIGGSDVGAILGFSKWGGPWDVWLSKATPVEVQDDRDNRAMMTGRLLEEAVGKWAATRLGCDPDALVQGVPAVKSEAPWMRATPDYFVWVDGQSIGLECKTAERPGDVWGPEGSGRVPVSYGAQCRWYMAVLDRPAWYLAVFFKRTDEWRLYRIERDMVWESRVVAAMAQWWERHVIQGHPPYTDASKACSAALPGLYPDESGRMRIADEREEEAVRTLHEIGEQVRALSTHRNRLRNHVRELIGSDEGLRFTGGYCRWSRKSNRLSVKVRD